MNFYYDKEKLSYERLLGKGKFGHVYLANLRIDNNRKKVAVKICEKPRHVDFSSSYDSQDFREALQNEIDILKSCNFKSIIKLYDNYNYKNKYYLIMEYVEGRDMYSRIQETKINEKEALRYVKQIARALIYLHLNYIFHGDLKPENIMLDREDKIKLIDFGHAKKFKPGQTFTETIGTVYYLAPEVAKRDSYDYKIDIWALGVIYYEMLAKIPPFFIEDAEEENTEDEEEILEMIIIGEYKFPSYFSSVLKKQIQKILQKANKRAALHDILAF